TFKEKVRCRPYAVWDDVPEVAQAMMDMGFEKIMKDPVELVKECDGVHIEHADYRRVFELAQPALEAGKPVFINRPFTATIADAEEAVRLAKTHNAPLMCPSSLEFQPEVTQMQQFARTDGPVRSYEAYCPEPIFPWMFPHVINFAHAGLGGGIESAYFTGDFIMNPGTWVHIREALMNTLDLTKFPKGYRPDYKKAGAEARPIGASFSLLTYKPRDGQPPMLGMHIVGEHPAPYHIDLYTMSGKRTFTAGDNLFYYMFKALHDFYADRKPPRPYEAILEQHRALVATNMSRLTGRTIRLDSLGGSDSLPWDDALRTWLIRFRLGAKSSWTK
ncbi:MAG: Gfo/Idh/MocA family oxidoreductase, partial [Candidatus Latescibacterota bacterium]